MNNADRPAMSQPINKAKQVKTMTKQEQLEKKALDAKAAADDAWDNTISLANVATYILSHTDYADYASFVNTEAAYLQARDELENYIKERDKV